MANKISLLINQFENNLNKIFKHKFPKKIAVAVSGGLDSMALLLLLKNICAQNFNQKVEIFCLTVDHNFRKNSASDAQFVFDFCQENAINCTILKSYLENPPEVDIESSLREVRYNLLGDFCQKNKIKYLFLAHHRQDLAENFLIRLFRGSGIDGLAAISCKSLVVSRKSLVVSRKSKIEIIRPLLEFSKSDLKKYLQATKTKWVEDETNFDEKYLRNKIRKFLQSLPDYEAINNRIALASEAILEAKNILEKQTKKEFPKIFKTEKNNLILNIEKFSQLEKSTATRYLSLALMQISGRIYKPRLKKLLGIYQKIIENKLLANEIFYGCILQKSASGNILITKQI
jgi:tRNA(Ile)-lysidine synthase